MPHADVMLQAIGMRPCVAEKAAEQARRRHEQQQQSRDQQTDPVLLDGLRLEGCHRSAINLKTALWASVFRLAELLLATRAANQDWLFAFFSG